MSVNGSNGGANGAGGPGGVGGGGVNGGDAAGRKRRNRKRRNRSNAKAVFVAKLLNPCRSSRVSLGFGWVSGSVIGPFRARVIGRLARSKASGAPSQPPRVHRGPLHVPGACDLLEHLPTREVRW